MGRSERRISSLIRASTAEILLCQARLTSCYSDIIIMDVFGLSLVLKPAPQERIYGSVNLVKNL